MTNLLDSQGRAVVNIKPRVGFGRRDEVVFDTPVIRHCNASMPNSQQSQMREPARAGSMAAAEIQSRGIGC